MGLENQPNVTPVFDAARDCFHHPDFNPANGYARQTVTSSVALDGPMTTMVRNFNSSMARIDEVGSQTSVAVCQPVDPATRAAIGAIVRSSQP